MPEKPVSLFDILTNDWGDTEKDIAEGAWRGTMYGTMGLGGQPFAINPELQASLVRIQQRLITEVMHNDVVGGFMEESVCGGDMVPPYHPYPG